MAGFHVTPFFRSPFTDLGGALVNAQHYDKCGELEMRMMECLEAHGAVKGKKVCADVIDDFHECFSLRKQQLRTLVSPTSGRVVTKLTNIFQTMRMERHKQWWNGERKEHYQTPGPRVDSF